MRPSNLKYYIHDSNASFRLELIGNLGGGDIPELQGCWETARTTLAGRDLVIDLRAVVARDQAGIDWLRSIADEGAAILERADKVKARAMKAAAASRKLPESVTQGR